MPRIIGLAALVTVACLLVVTPWQATSMPYGKYLASCRAHHVLAQCLASMGGQR